MKQFFQVSQKNEELHYKQLYLIFLFDMAKKQPCVYIM